MIFLVEDEQKLLELLESYLIEAGYDVRTFNNGLDAESCIDLCPELWILDIMLPGKDGFALIKTIKYLTPEVPVIFMSARSTELDRVLGLEMGSDDYLSKPFLPRELVLRVNRILKPQVIILPKLYLNDLCIDQSKREVYCNGKTAEITPKEYALLVFISLNKNKAMSRSDILDGVWGKDYFGSERVIDDTLRRIRKKFVNINIQPVYGYGYIFKDVYNEEK